MPNRVIRDSIWTSPTLSSLTGFAEDQWLRWLLMADDWGCFNADSKVVKGTCYPLRDEVTIKKIEELKREYFEKGLLFLWIQGERQWGFFVSWESHHDYCNKTSVDEKGKRTKHRRKTPEPPVEGIKEYLKGKRDFFKLWNNLGQVGTKVLIPNPNPIPNPKPSFRCVLKQNAASEKDLNLAAMDKGVQETKTPVAMGKAVQEAEPLQAGTSKVACDPGGKRKRGTQVPQDFSLSERMRQWAMDKGVQEPDEEFENFLDHHRAKGSVFRDWEAAWRTWARRSLSFSKKPFKPGGNKNGSKPATGKYDHLYE